MPRIVTLTPPFLTRARAIGITGASTISRDVARAVRQLASDTSLPMPGDVRAMMTYAGDKLAHLHIADCYNHRANAGNRYIINPPGADVRIHQHNEIGHGDLDWDEFFETFEDRELAFLHQDRTADGKPSRFFKFVRREEDDQ